MAETKAERFQRLAEARTNSAIDRIRIIGNLANRSAYEYSEEDIARMFRAISDALRATRSKFDDSASRRFRLRGE